MKAHGRVRTRSRLLAGVMAAGSLAFIPTIEGALTPARGQTPPSSQSQAQPQRQPPASTQSPTQSQQQRPSESQPPAASPSQQRESQSQPPSSIPQQGQSPRPAQ